MSANKQQILDTVLDLARDGCDGLQIDWGRDEHGTEYLIAGDWQTVSILNDKINAKHAPEAWAKARPIYLAAAEREAQRSRERSPGIHPANLKTHDPFASLRTYRGRLDVDAAHAHTAPYLMPEGVLSICEVDGLEQVFSDDHTVCECGIVLETEPSSMGWERPYRIQDGGLVCLECFDTEQGEDS